MKRENAKMGENAKRRRRWKIQTRRPAETVSMALRAFAHFRVEGSRLRDIPSGAFPKAPSCTRWPGLARFVLPGGRRSPMIDYQLWIHPELSDLFAVRLELGQVTGICPVLRESASKMKLTDLPYDDRPEAIRRARENPEQFMLWEHWWPGEWGLPAVPSRKLAPSDTQRQPLNGSGKGWARLVSTATGLRARLAKIESWIWGEARRGR
jgi:hypothetical protein